MTRTEYERKVKTFDRDKEDRLAALIPKNINPTGKLYRKLLKEIYESKYTNQK